MALAACRALGLFALARWLTRKRLKILCYHGFELDDEARFRPKLFIPARTFEQRLATIQRYRMEVLGLDEAIRRLYDGTLPAHALVITIDDGFHSVHSVAAPLLKRFSMPATVYVTTYYVEHQNPIFRLAVQYMFWRSRVPVVSLPDGMTTDDARFDLTVPDRREAAVWTVIRYGETKCNEPERLELCAKLGRLLEVPLGPLVARRTLHLMSPDELVSLDNFGIKVELHTHRHVFPDYDRAAAQQEIADNRAALARIIHCNLQHFCYPSGLWKQDQWSWLDDVGISSSVTCVPGLNSGATPRHALRRFLDGDNIGQLEFEAALCGFSDLVRAVRDRLRLA